MEQVNRNGLSSAAHDTTVSEPTGLTNQDGNKRSRADLTMKERFFRRRLANTTSASTSIVPTDKSTSTKAVEISSSTNSQTLHVEEPPEKISALESKYQVATKTLALTKSKISESQLSQLQFPHGDEPSSSAPALSSSSSRSDSIQNSEPISISTGLDCGVGSKMTVAERFKKRREKAEQKSIASSFKFESESKAEVETTNISNIDGNSEKRQTPISSFESATLPILGGNELKNNTNPPSHLNSISPTILQQVSSTAIQLDSNPTPMHLSTSPSTNPQIPSLENRGRATITIRDVINDETLTTATNIYVAALIKTIANVTISDLMRTQWNFFQFYAELELDESKIVVPKHFEKLKKYLEPLAVTMWEILFEKLVWPLEKKFKKSICFWGNELDKILQEYDTLLDSSVSSLCLLDFPQFPASLYTLLETKINHFVNETRQRNKKIQRMENEASQLCIKEAVKYFRHECETEIEFKYLEEDQLDKLLQKKGSQTLKYFENAMKLTCENSDEYPYDLSLCKKLENELFSISNEISKKSLENKNNVDKSIQLEMEKYIKSYSSKIQEFYQSQSRLRNYNLQNIQAKLTSFGRDILQEFDDWNKKKRNGPAEVVHKYRAQLRQVMGNDMKDKLREIQGEAEERERKQLEERKQTKEKVEKTNTMKSRYDSKQKARTQPGPEVDQASAGSGPSDSHFNNFNSQLSPVNEDADGMQSLPTATLAFHVGLNKTKMGITDNEGKFRVLINVPNELYVENSRLVPHFDKDDSSGRNVSIKGVLMNKIDKTHEIRLDGIQRSFRIETLLSFLLQPLKLKAELEFHKIFTRAVIVTPQTLNGTQRLAVKHGARLAGFEMVDLIDDTTALTFNFTMTYQIPKGQKLISINCFEGFIDAGLFSADNGRLTCLNKFGDFFLCESFRKWLVSFLLGGRSYPNPHGPNFSPKAIKAVVEKIVEDLRKDPNSNKIPCILACLDADSLKFNGGSLDFSSIHVVNNCYALEGAAAFVSMLNCPNVGNAHCRKWAGMNSGNLDMDTLERMLIDQGPLKYPAVQNPEQGENCNAATLYSIKQTELFDRMKTEEDACLELLKLAVNVERILFNSSNPYREEYKRTLNLYYEQFKNLIHVNLDEILSYREVISQMYNNLKKPF